MRRYWYPALLVAAAAACDKGSTDSGPQVGSVSLGFDARAVGVGQEVTLTATVLDPSKSVVKDARVRWETLNPGVASVTQEGVLRGNAVGSTQVVASAGGEADTATINVVSGVLRSFNVNSDQACTNPIFKDARQVASSARALIFEDITNPSGGFTADEYQQIADSFDRLIWPVVTQNFGEPSDTDGNGKVIILYTRAVNEMTPPNSGSVFGGFYYGRDLYPRTANARLGACAGSNEAEMFYLLAADPNGEVNQNKRAKDQVRRSTQGTVAHELQHLINASRRLLVLNSNSREETWLNEGLSHIAEELVFHAAAGTAPRQNLGEAEIKFSEQRRDAFNSYAISNFGRFRTFMETPSTESPIEADDDLETRGSAWHFLRYSADRRAGNDRDVWYALVNTTSSGLANYRAAFGAEPLDYLRDWTVSIYADDAVQGVEPRFTMPSWNFRSLYPLLTNPARYPLKVDTLVNGAPRTVAVQAGSAAYLRFAVPAGGTGDVRLSAANTAEAGACTPVALNVGQVYQGTPATTSALCVGEGEYTMIPFFRSETSGATAQMSVVATGITAPVGLPSPSLAPSTPLFNRSGTGLNPELMQDAVGIEARLRARERQELGRLVPGGFRANSSAAADPVAPEVRVSLLRTK